MFSVASQSFDKTEFQGEWQNSSKFINFDFEQNIIVHELKTFYGLWRDKSYYTKISDLAVFPLIYENELFMQYWILDDFYKIKNNTKLKLYLPANNIDEISLDDPKIYKYIYAYLFISDNEAIEIRYWLVNLDLDEEFLETQRAMVTESTVNLSNNEILSDLQDDYFRNIKKYIKIGDKIYTCVEGRGIKIRNIKIVNFKELFPNYKFFNKEKIT